MLPDYEAYIDYQNPKEEQVTEDEEDPENGKEAETYITTLYRAASESILTINSSTQKLKESDVKT